MNGLITSFLKKRKKEKEVRLGEKKKEGNIGFWSCVVTPGINALRRKRGRER